MNVDASILVNLMNMYNMNTSQFVRVKGVEEQSIASSKTPVNNTSTNTIATPTLETNLVSKSDVALQSKPLNSLPPVEQVSTQNILELTRQAKITNALSTVDTSKLVQNYGNDNVVHNSLSTVAMNTAPLVIQASEETEPTTLQSVALAPSETQTPIAAVNDESVVSAMPTMNEANNEYFSDMEEDGVYSVKIQPQEGLSDGMTENEALGNYNGQSVDNQTAKEMNDYVEAQMNELGMTRKEYEELVFGDEALFG